jgi:Nuclease-related domain
MRALAALAALVAATAVAGLVIGIHSLVFAGVETIVIVVMFAGNRLVNRVMDRRIRGVEGELHVGAILDALEPYGWRTLHDVATGRGNVDHIAIGPGGLLTVETKSHPGRISVAAVDPAWLKQAYAQRKHIERLTGHSADCLLVFSRAFLDRAPRRRRGVMMLPARMLAGYLKRQDPVLGPEQVQALHRQLVDALASSTAAP